MAGCLYVQIENARTIHIQGRYLWTSSFNRFSTQYIHRTSAALSQFVCQDCHKFRVMNHKITFVRSVTSDNASILDLECLACASLLSMRVEASPHEVPSGARYQTRRLAPAGCHGCVCDAHFESHRTIQQARRCPPVAKPIRIQERHLVG